MQRKIQMLEADLEKAEERGEEMSARKDELEQELEEANRTIKTMKNDTERLEGTVSMSINGLG